MMTGFGEKCAAVRRGIGVAQEYMANMLVLGSSKAFSRFEHEDGCYTDEQYELAARALGFRSADSLLGFDLRRSIAKYEAEKDAPSTLALPELIVERDQLVEKVGRLERENDRLVKVEEILLEHLQRSKAG